MKLYYLTLSIPFLTVSGSLMSGEIMGSSRSIILADPLIYIITIISLQRAIANGYRILDRISISFLLMLIFLAFSAIYKGTYVKSEFLFPFKNLTTCFFLYLITVYTIDTPQKLTHLFYSLVGATVVLCLKAKSGFSSNDAFEIAHNRGLGFAGGYTWNALVGTLSYILPFVFILLSRSFALKKHIAKVTLVMVFVAFIFIAVLSGGRQALGTMIISGILFILWNNNTAKSKKIFALSLIFICLILSFWLVLKFFPEFARFAADKRSRVGSDFIDQRVINSLYLPLMNFDILEYLIFGDGISNKHNIITTVLYRFGIVGFIFFFLRFNFYYKNAKWLYLEKEKVFQKEFGFPIIKFILILFINFFITNYVANIWYQVIVYGYFFWISLGAIMGALSHTINPNEQNIKPEKL